jgi:hypothetical protein
VRIVSGGTFGAQLYMKRSNRSFFALHIGHCSGGSSLAHR